MPLETATEPPFGHVMRQMSRMMDQFQKGFMTFRPSETWVPSVNLYEMDDCYLVCVDLAGVDKQKIELVIEDSHLKLRGNREVPMRLRSGESAGRMRVHLMEIDHGAFCRDVELPHDVVADKIKARHDNGLLWVEIPKK